MATKTRHERGAALKSLVNPDVSFVSNGEIHPDLTGRINQRGLYISPGSQLVTQEGNQEWSPFGKISDDFKMVAYIWFCELLKKKNFIAQFWSGLGRASAMGKWTYLLGCLKDKNQNRINSWLTDGEEDMLLVLHHSMVEETWGRLIFKMNSTDSRKTHTNKYWFFGSISESTI